MKELEKSGSVTSLTAAQEFLRQLWEEHVRHEFATHDTEDTLSTMVEDAYVNHIPVLTGGVGRDELQEFYCKRFIPQMPPDTEMTPISRTIGNDQLVAEMVLKFTHTIRMDWMLPGIAPNNNFQRGKKTEKCLLCHKTTLGQTLLSDNPRFMRLGARLGAPQIIEENNCQVSKAFRRR